MTRDDLLGLSIEALTALANPGFVRRARKDLDAGRAPEVEVDGDGTVTARFDDGVVTRLPAGTPIRDATCSCPASGWCRHRVTLVLAYQDRYGDGAPQSGDGESGGGQSGGGQSGGGESGSAAEPEPPPWSPGRFDDVTLAATLPARSLERARQSAAKSLTVRLSAPGGVPTAQLPMNVVRFFSATSLAHAHCDCREAGRCEHLALAVWAFRRAGTAAGSAMAGEVDVVLGGAAVSPGLEHQLTLVRDQVAAACREVVLTGAGHADNAVRARLERATEVVRRLGWSWVVADLTEIGRQLEARLRRSTAADPARLCSLLAEAPARLDSALAVARSEAPMRGAADILGAGVPGEAELAHLRLVSLGARCWSVPDESGGTAQVGAQVFLLDPDTGQVSVLERLWDGPAPASGRRLLGSSLARIAESQLVTAAAKRRALGLVEIAADRRRTSVTPLGPRSWPCAGWIDTDATASGLPPWIRSRNLGRALVTVAVEQVTDWGWDPAAQRLVALVTTPSGPVTLEWSHSAAEPGGVDAIAAVLTADGPRTVSGELRRRGGAPVIRLLALGTEDEAVVPATRPVVERGPLPTAPVVPRTAHGALVTEVHAELVSWVHRGVRQQGRPALDRLAGLAQRLVSAGLTGTAELLTAVVRTTPDDPDRAADQVLRAILVLDQLDQRL